MFKLKEVKIPMALTMAYFSAIMSGISFKISLPGFGLFFLAMTILYIRFYLRNNENTSSKKDDSSSKKV